MREVSSSAYLALKKLQTQEEGETLVGAKEQVNGKGSVSNGSGDRGINGQKGWGVIIGYKKTCEKGAILGDCYRNKQKERPPGSKRWGEAWKKKKKKFRRTSQRRPVNIKKFGDVDSAHLRGDEREGGDQEPPNGIGVVVIRQEKGVNWTSSKKEPYWKDGMELEEKKKNKHKASRVPVGSWGAITCLE